MGDEEKVSRRRFGGLLTLGSIGAAIAALWGVRRYFHAEANEAVVIAETGSLAPGGSLVFQYPTPEAPCLLICTGAEKYVAYSRICTHAGCPVFFHSENNDIECPCHGGVFSVADGHVLAGPPPRPLPRIELEVRGRDIIAVGISKS